MTGVLSTMQRRLLAMFIIVAALFGASAVAIATAQPAQASQGVSADCSIRVSKQITFVDQGVRKTLGCGYTVGSTNVNGISSVRVGDVPFCVYFGSTLAGCGSPNQSLSVSNRSGQYARIVPQNPASR